MSYAMLLPTVQHTQTVQLDNQLNLPAGVFTHVMRFVRRLKRKCPR